MIILKLTCLRCLVIMFWIENNQEDMYTVSKPIVYYKLFKLEPLLFV